MKKETKYVSAQEAVRHIQSHNRVFVHGSAATPITVVQALMDRKEELRNVELVSISTLGFDLNDPSLEGHFFINSLFFNISSQVILQSLILSSISLLTISDR